MSATVNGASATADARFAACLAETREIEGGWSDDPADRGGPTMKGITIGVYAGWVGATVKRGADGQFIRDAAFLALMERLRNIDDETVAAICRANYWNAIRGDELPAGIDIAVWDYCLNSGPAQAIKSLQLSIGGLVVDGHLGPATLDAVRTAPAQWLIPEYLDERRRFLRGRSNYWRFGKGWENRCDRVEGLALAMAGHAVMADARAVAPPLPDADAQSASQARAPAETPRPPVTTEVTLASGGLVSKIGGVANALGKIGAMQAPTCKAVLFAFLSEPLVLTGFVMVMGALTTWLWRRKHA